MTLSGLGWLRGDMVMVKRVMMDFEKKNCKLVPESDQNGVFEDVQSSPTENFASPAVLAP